MLPSTGYFKAINCPFYENGYCERPYCHFRHSRRDGASTSTVVTSEVNQTVSNAQNASTAVKATNSDVIQKLVSEAVKKVLADQNVTDSDNIVNKVVAGLKPTFPTVLPGVHPAVRPAVHSTVHPAVRPAVHTAVHPAVRPTVRPAVHPTVRPSVHSAVHPPVHPAAHPAAHPAVLPTALPTVRPAILSTINPITKEIVKDPIVESYKQEATVGKHMSLPPLPSAKPSQCTYNPTPIAELEKRHVPIPAYEPSRESSKAVKRKSPDTERPWMAVIRNVAGLKQDGKMLYTPTGIGKSSSVENNSYLPSSSLYDVSSSKNHSYIPEKKKKRDHHHHHHHPKVKKRREEYVPRKPKRPLKDRKSLEDDTDILEEIFCTAESNPNATADEESRNSMEVDPKYSDDADVIHIADVTKDNERVDAVGNKGVKSDKEKNNANNNKSSDHSNKDKSHRHEESSKYDKEDTSKSKSKSEKSSKEDSKHKDKYKDKEDSKHSKKDDNSKPSKSKEDESKPSKSKEDESKHSKNKDDDWKYVKIKEEDAKYKSKEDSKYSKSKDKDKEEEKKDKEKEKDKSKEKDKDKDKNKHISKDKEHSSSSTRDSKSKEKDKDKIKDERGSSSIKKDSKSDKEKSSSSKDSKDNKKDKIDRKIDEKSKSKSKSSSSDSKSKSSKHKNSDKHSSHSSHKSSRSSEKTTESEDESSDKSDDKSDKEEKSDSPEYEEFSPFYDEQLLETDSDYDDVEAECRKIFQEYEVTDHPKDATSKAPPKPDVEESEETSKKRVAHPSAVSSITKQVGPTQPPKRLPNPQQRMYERWRMMKEIAAEKAAEKAAANKISDDEKRKKQLQAALVRKSLEHSSLLNNDHQINGNGRIRIAQVPYARSLDLEKKKVLDKVAKQETKTVAQTKKGGSRVAHIPQVVPQLIRPEPLQTSSAAQKFPLNVRQFYLNAMHDICIQIYTNSDDAAQRAVREEFASYERCKALMIYKNSCMLTVHRLRKEVDQKSNESSSSSHGTISHEAVLAGKSKGSWSVIKPKKFMTIFKGASLYNKLTKWILTEQDLKDNGFPRPHPEGPKGRAKLYVSNVRGQSTLSKVPNERFCCRCNKPFMVDKNGFPLRKENCIYHYARKVTFRGESKYMCCKQDGSSDGCCDATTHVWDFVDLDNLRGYVQTFDKGNAPAEEQGIFALDCEMCYTTQGLELTRVTVINEDSQVVYETLVKPSHSIIDYNTRFSGISEGDMKNVTTTLLDVQATLLSMFSSKTILIGHSLESDFKALKLLHNTVVDTSVMFPHKNGPPYKRALKTLCSEYLRKIIQNELGGHDSKEDAVACMELVLWKVKEEAKLQ